MRQRTADRTLPALESLRLQRLIGAWECLAALRDADLEAHTDRVALVLMAIEGCQQLGLWNESRTLIESAQQWGCPQNELAEVLLAGVHNTLGLASVTLGDEERALAHFSLAVAMEGPDANTAALAHARMSYQCRNIAHWDAAPENEFKQPKSGILSYAQNFEDVILWRALGLVEKGFYIDIGAQDPIVDSISRAFYENGWRGIHVEPTPTYAKKIRCNRPDEEVIQAVVAERAGPIKFYEFPDTGISTGGKELAARHIRNGFEMTEIEVACVSLEKILSENACRAIHWMKIDVEGMEAEVLRSWGDAEQRPWVVVVESTLPLTQTSAHAAWEDYLTIRDYEFVYGDGLNRFYLSKDHLLLKPAFAYPPNVFDGFVMSGTGTASFNRRNLP